MLGIYDSTVYDTRYAPLLSCTSAIPYLVARVQFYTSQNYFKHLNDIS